MTESNFLLIILLTILLNSMAQAQYDTNMYDGRHVMTHLFEWKWNDIADECERWLGPKGYGGVQVSPPQECVLVNTENFQRPWWERYQPVSYSLESRSGDENAFKDMVNRCNNAGVRIYADIVVNHMTGDWPEGTLSTGSSKFIYSEESYSGVPYTKDHFNDLKCNTHSGNIENYFDANQVRYCKLAGLNDLNQTSNYVRQKIGDYLNKLTSYGVAGFRFDAAKHMAPEDMWEIIHNLNNLPTQLFKVGSRPFVFQEVIDLGHSEPITNNEYIDNGRVTEFKYGIKLGTVFHRHDQLKYLKNWGEEWSLLDSNHALAFIDNHDNQRGHGGGGDNILTFRESKLYKMATAFMLAHPYGVTRVMSSYHWEKHMIDGHDENDWMGPPHDESFNIVSPIFNDDDSCGNGWICEHRWREIANMVEFRNVIHGTNINDWWDNGNNQIAFCRGSKGFIAINNEGSDMKVDLQTCLPPGQYCDIISGSNIGSGCTGKTVNVRSDGRAYIEILHNEDNGVLAIYGNLEKDNVKLQDYPVIINNDLQVSLQHHTGALHFQTQLNPYLQFNPCKSAELRNVTKFKTVEYPYLNSMANALYTCNIFPLTLLSILIYLITLSRNLTTFKIKKNEEESNSIIKLYKSDSP